MCGIAGFFGRFSKETLDAMMAKITHRGPDDQGSWLDPSSGIGLGHLRLSIIDLSPNGHQPMPNESRKLWLTYNGEIYNYRELRKFLENRGHHFKSHADSEVILHLYEEYGVDMLKRLDGIFAFALWDGEKKELFLARDAMGVKPLYYSENKKGFIFASEMKALINLPFMDKEIDFQALDCYLAYLWAPAPKTMLKSIRKLPPASAVLVKDGEIKSQWCWYKIPYDGSRIRISENMMADELSLRVEEAVKKQLVSDVPVGAFLSGGVDSSAVVAMMRKLMPEKSINCYCIGFSSGKEIEGNPHDLPYARLAAREFNVNLREIVVEPDNLISHLHDALYTLDEPTADPAPLNIMLIAKKAREDGIKVLLSGCGGDDVFSGYRRHAALSLECLYSWLPTYLRHWILVNLGRYGRVQYPLIRRVKKVLAYADKDSRQRLLAAFRWSSDDLREHLLSAEVKGALEEYSISFPLEESLHAIPDENDVLNQMLYLEKKHFLSDHNLNYTDKASMKYAVEVRVPLLDVPLVNFATSIPPAQKQKRWKSKAIFKKAMHRYLPEEIINRKKTGFGAPIRQWVKRDLKVFINDVLSVDAIKRRGFFKPEQVLKMIKQNYNDEVDASYVIFSLLCIELWCRIFIDQTMSVG